MPKVLQDYLNDYYSAAIIKKSPTENIKSALQELINSTPEDKKAAEVKLRALRDVEKRCFISQVHAKFLAEALNG